MGFMEQFNNVGDRWVKSLNAVADGKTSVKMHEYLFRVTSDAISEVSFGHVFPCDLCSNNSNTISCFLIFQVNVLIQNWFSQVIQIKLLPLLFMCSVYSIFWYTSILAGLLSSHLGRVPSLGVHWLESNRESARVMSRLANHLRVSVC